MKNTAKSAHAKFMRQFRPGSKLRKAGHNFTAIFLVLVLSVWQTPAVAFAANDDDAAADAVETTQVEATPVADADDEPAVNDTPAPTQDASGEAATEDAAPDDSGADAKDDTPASADKAAADADKEAASSPDAAAAKDDAADAEEDAAAEDEALPQKWTIEFDANGGTLRADADDKPLELIEDSGAVKLPKKLYEREDYTFTGWNTVPDPEAEGVDKKKALFVPEGAKLKNLAYRYVVLTEDNATKKELEDAIEASDGTLIKLVEWGTDEEDAKTKDAKDREIKTCDLRDLAKDDTLTLYAQWQEEAKDNADDAEGAEAAEDAAPADAADETDADAADNADNANGATAADEADNADSADAAPATEDATPADEAPATYTENNDLEAVDVQGPAAKNKAAARQALAALPQLNTQEASKAADQLFTAAATPQQEDVPRQLDGSNIENISAKWITPDTVDNGDASLLYVKPSKDEDQSVRLQINYALSGEHNYDPGDITITVPAYIFKNRAGNNYGTMIIPFPEDPSQKGDFNWKLVGDNYVLTNTKRMSAATKGYIQFAIGDMVPHQLVDMQLSDEFDAYIEVVTHKGNTIALRSNALTAQFDTEAVVSNVAKRVYGSPQRVSASEIPESQRIEGESEYIKVNWYVWGVTEANTLYVLNQTDSIDGSLTVGAVAAPTADDPKATKDITEAEAQGFVIGATSEDGRTLVKPEVYRGYQDGQTGYYYFSTAYPASQFMPDTDYTFHNSVEFEVVEVDPVATVTNPNVDNGTDVDGNALGSADPQKVTRVVANAQTTWSYTDPKWVDPTGHFMVVKNGNDDKEQNGTAKRNYTHKKSYTGSYSDLHLWSWSPNGWYGIYPSAINDLQDQFEANGTDGGVHLSYTIDSVGYVMPWMFDSASYDTDHELAPRKSSNYTRPVQMVTTDTGISIGRYSEKLKVGPDYEFVSVEFPDSPWIYTGTPQNINPDGSWAAVTADDGTFKYVRDMDKANWPDIELQIQRGDKWVHWATASWKSGNKVITLADGTTQTDGVVDVPSDTQNFRTLVTLQNTSKDAQANLCLQAAIDYDVRPVIQLKSTEAMMALIDAAFAKSNAPEMFVYNGVNMKAYDAEDAEIVSIDKDGYDSIRGYTTDTMVYPSKSSKQSITDVDYEARLITIHYSAKVEERSIINDKKTWEQAVADGRLVAETHGIWRDLLPKGVTPDVKTVKLRNGDTVTDAYTIENYEKSGRTMLVVEADLTPTAVQYRSGDLYYYEDVPSISFDAVYDFDSYVDYGDTLHNVISFESSNDAMGTVKDYTGEPDDARSSNNVATERAFDSDAERDAMTDLNPDRDTPSFVYAGTYTKLDVISAARLSLQKDVMVNNDGYWSTGLYYTDDKNTPEAPEGNRRTVYEGGQYSYRLRMMSDDATISKDLILYDSLEDFKAGDGNDAMDIDAPTWQGTFRSVDVSQMEAMGCAPVVYYHVGNIQLSDETDPEKGNATNMDLSNSSLWVKASEYTGDLAAVKGIAVDASKKADGSDFELQPMESVVVIVNMQAPSGDEARALIHSDAATVHDQSAHAYNNAYLTGTSLKADTREYDGENFVRKDYTKVGLMEYNYTITKVWNDDNNRDGVRPAVDENAGTYPAVAYHLLRDGVETGDVAYLNAEGKAVFEHLPYTDPDGNKYRYSAREDAVEGYTTTWEYDTNSAVFTNTHAPERVSVSGQKLWQGDEGNEDARPESITVQLYKQVGPNATPSFVKSQTVKPNAEGTWSYSFDNLYKYENGTEITYTVREVASAGKGASYTSELDSDGRTFVNTYHPYGNLLVSKTVEDTTSVSVETEFPFTFEFTRMVEGQDDPEPVSDDFAYEVLDAEGQPVLDADGNPVGGTLTRDNRTVALKGGQTIHVKDVPEYVNYTVKEDVQAGFTQSAASGAEGTIAPNATQQSSFTNTYAASGRVNLAATKTLLNRELKRYQFRFELYQVDDQGKETLVRTASNARPSDPVLREDETVESSTADVTFGAISYTQADAEAQLVAGAAEGLEGPKPYTYVIREVVPDDAVNADGVAYADADAEQKAAGGFAKAGYTYAAAEYTVQVTVVDNGDGTLGITPVYGQMVKVDDLPFGLVSHEEFQEADEAAFQNVYEAEGNITLRAWKDLQGRTLKDGEFTFELLDEEGNPVPDADGNPATATNTADGSVVFAPENIPALNYTQEDIGKTYHYGLRETAGDDETVNYDSNLYGYYVTVVDNEDGTLSLAQGTSAPVFEDGDEGKTLSGWNDDGELPVFTNTLKDGSLSITKLTQDADNADPNQEFNFKVKLIGEGVEDGEISYALSRTEEASTGSTTSSSTSSGEGSTVGTVVASKPDTSKVFHVSDDDPMMAGISYSILTDDGDLIFFRDEPGKYSAGMGKTVTINGKEYTGRVGVDIDSWRKASYGNQPWGENNSRIKTVRVADGFAIKPIDMTSWFSNCSGITSIDTSRMDTSRVTSMRFTFSCSNLTELDLSGFDTSSVTDMSSMFNYAKSITRLDVSSFDTSSVANMSQMFYSMYSLESLDISHFDTSGATNVSNMFNGMKSLTSLDLSGVDTSKVEWASSMFGGCDKLSTVTLGPLFDFVPPNRDSYYQTIQLPTPPNSAPYTGKWIQVGASDDEALTPVELRDSYDSSMAGTWVWQKMSSYAVDYTAEDATGSMQRSKFDSTADEVLPPCGFYRYGYQFEYWEDANGKRFEDGGTIPAGTYDIGEKVTLTAHFVPVDTTAQIVNGEFDLTLHGNETATFDNLPAGTAYQVWEETPDGWVLVEQSNVSGTIEPLETAEASFTNKYQPGVTTAQFAGTKTLDGKAAEAGTYSFTLSENGEVLQTKETQAGGFIQFDAIEYDNAGTHTYTIAEVNPNNPDIDYDTHKEIVTVEVTDNGDGTLSSKTTYDADGISFANKTRPGNLKVTKEVQNPTTANADDEFTFKITLNNPNGQPIGSGDEVYWYIEGSNGQVVQKQQAAPKRAKAAEVPATEPQVASDEEKQAENSDTDESSSPTEEAAGANILSSLASIPSAIGNFITPKAYAADLSAYPASGATVSQSGTSGTCTWHLYSDGTLVISPTNSSGGTLGSYSRYSYVPWYAYRTDVKRVKFDENVRAGSSLYGAFYGMSNLIEVDFSDLNTDETTAMNSMFYNCSSLKELDLSGLNTNKVTTMSSMFGGCSSLVSVNLSNVDTSMVTKMASMFSGCYSLKELDVSTLSTEKVTDMSYMFSGCGALQGLDLSGFDTGAVTQMNDMFYNCSSLSRLDVTSFDTSKVTSMLRMFKQCSSLSRLDVSSFDVRNVTDMQEMFRGMESLQSLDLSNFNTPKLTNMGAMFYNCYALEEIKLTNFDTSNVTDMVNQASVYSALNQNVGLFYNCRSLKAIDLSSFDTGKVQNLGGLFFGCSSLKKVDLSNFNTSNVRYMNRMFYNCSSLEEIDISGFDASNVVAADSGNWLHGIQEMFYGCRKLSKVNLSDKYSFGGNGSSSAGYYAVLPTPPSSIPYTGNWIREDKTYGPYSAATLKTSYSPAMAGVWVWEIDQTKGLVQFDANGGYTSATQVTATSATQAIAMPGGKTTRPHYVLTGWNTKQDGSGTSYGANEISSNVVKLGAITTLYAQWEATDLRDYKVRHYQQNTSLNGYNLVTTETLHADKDTTVTPAVKSYAGFVSPEAKNAVVLDDDSLVVDYYYDRVTYEVAFDGNGATSGQMNDNQTMVGGISKALPANTFQKKGSLFNGWNTKADGSGTAYIDKATVRDLATENGEVVTLYAQWLSNEDNLLEPTNGVVYVKVKAGQTAVLPDLPAGTTYTIEEVDVPNGWTQTGTVGDTGAIAANITSASTVTNRYEAQGFAQIVAHKAMEGESLNADDFSFQLLDSSGRVIETVTNGDVDTDKRIIETVDGEDVSADNAWYGTAPVSFSPLTYTQADQGRTFTYYVREVAGSADSGVNYDTHTERVTVTVTDAGSGVLETSVLYDADGALFSNNMKDSTLRIAKTALGNSGDEDFTFTVDLKDADGNPLDGEYAVKTYTKDYKPNTSVTKYSHSSNISDEGVRTGDYPANLNNGSSNNPRDIITVPGAKSLHVKMTYATENSYDRVYVFQGVYTAAVQRYMNSGFYRYFTGGGYNPITTEFDLPGDSVTFAFATDGSVYGYGYYAVITGGTPESGFKTDTLTSGGTITLKGGEYAEITGLPHGATYTVTEAEKANWKQTAADGDDGTLQAGQTSIAKFTNTYQPSPDEPYDAFGSAAITATKSMPGSAITEDDDFAFQLVDANGDVLQTRGVDSFGGETSSITFSDLAYSLEDAGQTYTYTLREVAGADSDITYDSTVYTVNVAVGADDGSGVLPTTVTYGNYNANDEFVEAADGAVFTNLRAQPVTISGTKVWDDADNANGTRPESITVNLLANGRVVQSAPVESDDQGNWSFTFDDLPRYNNGEEIAYTVKEAPVDGYSATYEGDAETGFTITNRPAPTLQFAKYLFGSDDDISDLAFDFTLVKTDASGNPLENSLLAPDAAYTDTVQNAKFKGDTASVTFQLPALPAGDHYYTVAEQESTYSDIAADTMSYLVHVVVDESGVATSIDYYLVDEEGIVSDEPDPAPAFYNNTTGDVLLFSSAAMSGYDGTSGRISVYPEVQKYMDGSTAPLVGGDYLFTLSGEGVSTTQANDIAGNVAFYDEDDTMGLVFDAPGTYVYTISEQVPADAVDNGDGTATADGVIYDASDIAMTVEVTENDGVLSADVSYSGMLRGTAPAFYNATVGASNTPVDTEVSLSVDKFEAGTHAYLPDAELEVVDASGNVVDSWTTDGSVHVVSGLTPGASYTLSEVAAPEGYEQVGDTEFTVSADGTGVALTAKDTSTELSEALRIALYDPAEPIEKEKIVYKDGSGSGTPGTSTNTGKSKGDTPDASGKNGVKTGDTAPVAPLAALAVCGLLVVAYAIKRRRDQEGVAASHGAHARS